MMISSGFATTIIKPYRAYFLDNLSAAGEKTTSTLPHWQSLSTMYGFKIVSLSGDPSSFYTTVASADASGFPIASRGLAQHIHHPLPKLLLFLRVAIPGILYSFLLI